jgi:hypothetical protein
MEMKILYEISIQKFDFELKMTILCDGKSRWYSEIKYLFY